MTLSLTDTGTYIGGLTLDFTIEKASITITADSVENGVINGYGDGRLGPKGLAARAQVAQMLMNFLKEQ